MAKRDAYFDNLKIALMVLVVLAHGMEIVAGPVLGVLYKLIYLFHMPAFILVSGYFTKLQSPVKIGNLLLQYLTFQTLYLLFMGWLNGTPLTGVTLQYTTPFWILWFSFSTILWKMAAPYIARIPKAAALALTAAWALIVGFMPDIGYAFSASRMFVFLPFFVAGYWMEESHLHAIRKIPAWAALLAFAGSFWLLARVVNLPTGLLYGSRGYAELGMAGASGPLWRALAMGWGMLLVVFFMACIPAKSMPLVTNLGANTMQVYYLHGFALKWAAVFVPPLVCGLPGRKAIFYIALLALTVALASKPVAWATRPLLSPISCIKQWQKARAAKKQA